MRGRGGVVVFDESCALCVSAAPVLERLSGFEARPVSIATILREQPGLDGEKLRRAITFIGANGEEHAGIRALIELIRSGRPALGRVLLLLYRIPPVAPCADWLYTRLAANRYRLSSCSADSSSR